MNYVTHPDFLTPSFCRYLIGILNKDKNPEHYEDGCIITRLYDQAPTHDTIKILLQRITTFGLEHFGTNHYIQDIQVVKRTNMEMVMHKDVEHHVKSLVCFLNDDYAGGHAIVEDDYIRPEVGTAVVVDGNKVSHGVAPIKGDRYVLLVWWSLTP